MSSSAATSHPNIAKITRQIEVVDGLYSSSNFYDAWLCMRIIMRGLKPSHKKRRDYVKLLKNLNYAIRRINMVRFLNAPDAALKRVRLAEVLDKDFHSRFMSLLWDCNMLTAGAYEYYDPTDGKGSDEVIVEIGERDTTRIR